jgi:hypothetical protein
MSIIKNGKTVAGSYNVSAASDATTEKKGIIRIATDEEAQAGELTNVAVTPKQLAENGGGTEVDTSNLVTLDGEQTITGAKTFGSDIQLGSNSLSFSDGALTLNPQGSSNLNITTMGGALDVTGNLTLTGNIKAYQNQAKPIELRSDGSTMSVAYGDNTLNMSDDSLTYTNASGETKDLLASGGGSSDNAVTLDTNQTITGQKTFTQQIQCSPTGSAKDMWLGQSGPGAYGLIFQSNNSPYEFTIYNQGYTASSLKVAGFEGGIKFANTVNFNSSIYDKDGNEIVGGSSGGSVDTSNLVTTDTEQTITGKKTFSVGGEYSPNTLNIVPHINTSNDSSSNSFSIKGNDGYSDFLGISCNRHGGYPYTLQTLIDFTSDLKLVGYRGGSTVSFGTSAWQTRPQTYTTGNGADGYKPLLHFGNITAGDGVTITDNGDSGITLSATGGGGSSGGSEFTYGTLDWDWNYDYYSGAFGWLHHEPSGIMIQGGQLPYFSGNLEAVAVVNFEKPYKTLCSIIVFDVYDKILFSTIQLWDDIDEEGNQGILGFELEEQPHMDTYWIAFGY